MAQISIPGGNGSSLTFSITGNAATNYARDFNNAVQNVQDIQWLSSGGVESTVAGALNLIGTSSTSSYILGTGGQYTFASVGGATQITGSSAGSDWLVAGGGVTYSAESGDNRVVFFSGDNAFNGGSTAGNTVSSGSGNDTVNAGTGSTTVFGGTGNLLLNLNDSAAGAGDVAILAGGSATVNAFGAADTIFAAGTDSVVGGAHLLTFVSMPDPSSLADPLSATVVAGTGGANIFGTTGTDITLEGASGSGPSLFVAGAGNETLNAAAASGDVSVFANAVSGNAGNVNESVTGGSGKTLFMTGTGREIFQAGSGTTLIDIDSVAGGAITVAGFTADSYVALNGMSQSDAESVFGSSASLNGGNLVVTLGNGTTIEFMGVTTLANHIV